MGKQRSSVHRRNAEKLVKMFPDKFSEDFEQDKRFLDSLKIINDKLTRNIMAGIIVKLVKTQRAKAAREASSAPAPATAA